ncbi:MAG: hypothetical protein H7226_02170 [Salinibacterium sp.]|nr:hypothetical protein [Salinibacterium sp.]
MTLLPDFIHLRWLRPGLSASERALGLAILSPAEITRADSDSFVAGRMLLRTLAGEILGIEAQAVPLSATCPDCGGPHGQPRIAGLAVSLSRCATAVVAVAALKGSVGVDVEPRQGSAERAAAIMEVAGPGSIRAIQRWTSVEAALKADGRGLRLDPRNVGVTADRATLGDARYELWHPEPAPDLQVTVAWRASAPAGHIDSAIVVAMSAG